MLKRTLLLAVVSLLVAGSALAYVPLFPVSEVTVRTGDQIRVSVYAAWSGLDTSFNYYHWEFVSADERVALVEGTMQSPASSGVITITGIAPGETSAQISRNGNWSWLRIHVVCGFEPPVIAAKPVITALLDQQVSIQAITPTQAVFLWYSGRIGDTSHPITDGGAGPELRLIPETFGTRYVWVLARTQCSESTAEFRIDVTPPRRRSAGR